MQTTPSPSVGKEVEVERRRGGGSKREGRVVELEGVEEVEGEGWRN